MRRAFILLLLAPIMRLMAADGEWTRTIETTVASRDVQRGIERAKASVRPAGWLTDETWRFGTWLNLPVENTRGREFAVLAGYTHTFGSDVRAGLEVTHYFLGDTRDGHPSHTGEVAAIFSLPAGPARLGASVARDVNRRADIGELSYAGEYALKNWGAFLHYRFYVGAVEADDVLPQRSAPRIEDSYTYHGVDLAVPYRIGGQTVLTAGVHYAGTTGARPFWSPIGARPGDKVWFTLAASREF
jgi:hypothetical protein